MDSKRPGRRRFLKHGAALAGLAVGAVRSASGHTAGSETPAAHPRDAQVYGEPSHFVTEERGVTTGLTHTTYRTPLQDVVGIITPASLHFMQSHSRIPDIDPQQYRLVVHGMVERPLTFTLEDLKRLPSESRIHFLECLGDGGRGAMDNAMSSTTKGVAKGTVQQFYGITSCSEWTGVPLSALFKETGLQQGAKWLVAEGGDSGKYSYCIPLTKAMDDVMVAYGQNGEPVRREQGYPARLLVPGWGANHSVKWLRQIKVVDERYLTWDQSVHHTMERGDLDGKSRWYRFAMPPRSVILRPSGGQQLPGRGFYEITGLAWSGGGAIRRVEVSTDGGQRWKEAKLQEPVLRMAHTRFTFDWTWDGGETVLQSRCTDDQGEVQPSLEELNRDWGISEKVTVQTVGHAEPREFFNAIQPWRVAPDGSVHDAMFS